MEAVGQKALAKRENWIDGLRGFAICSMVMAHTEDQLGTFLGYDWVTLMFMPLFFFVSGLLHKDIVPFKKFKSRIWHRLLLPYILSSILFEFLLYKKFWVALLHHDTSFIEDLLINFGGGQMLWYVPCLISIEIIAFLIQPLFKGASERRSVIIKLLIIVTSTIYLFQIKPSFSVWHVETAFAVLCFYYSGNLFNIWRKSHRIFINKFLAILLVISYVALAVIAKVHGTEFDIHQHILKNPILVVLFAYSGIAVAVYVAHCFNSPRFLNYVGINSLLIYIFHVKFLTWISKGYLIVCSHLGLRIPIPFLDAAILIITILVCCAFVKPINKYFPQLVGNRS